MIKWSIIHEMAITLEDVLARRTRCVFLDSNESKRIAPSVTKKMAEILEKDQVWIDTELKNFNKLIKKLYSMISPYIAEFVGTAILLLLGSGIVANVSLSKTKGYDQTPLITITTAWGFAVFVAAFITGQFSGAHLNPAVTIWFSYCWKILK